MKIPLKEAVGKLVKLFKDAGAYDDAVYIDAITPLTSFFTNLEFQSAVDTLLDSGMNDSVVEHLRTIDSLLDSMKDDEKVIGYISHIVQMLDWLFGLIPATIKTQTYFFKPTSSWISYLKDAKKEPFYLPSYLWVSNVANGYQGRIILPVGQKMIDFGDQGILLPRGLIGELEILMDNGVSILLFTVK